MRISVFTLAILLISGVSTAQATDVPVKSRVVGAKLRIVERACKANLESYCKQNGGGVAVELKFIKLHDDPQYDVQCTAVCRVMGK